jgi:hypothetical protein
VDTSWFPPKDPDRRIGDDPAWGIAYTPSLKIYHAIDSGPYGVFPPLTAPFACIRQWGAVDPLIPVAVGRGLPDSGRDAMGLERIGERAI